MNERMGILKGFMVQEADIPQIVTRWPRLT